MRRRILSLLQKELRQHGLASVTTLGFVAMVYVVMLLGRSSGVTQVTLLEVHASFARLCIPLLAAVFGHRLVVTELYGRTQLFLEGLPVRRGEWMLVKAGLGLVVVLGAAFASLGISALAASGKEALDVPFLALLGVRTLVWSACVWSFFLAMGTSGRLRFFIYFSVALGLYAVDAMTELEWRRMPPFSLVDARMALERVHWPTRDLWLSAALALGFTALATWLTGFHEGSVSEALSRRMSQKEMVLLACVVGAALIGITVLEAEKTKDPYQLQGSTVQVGKRAAVSVDAGSLDAHAMARAAALLATLESDVLELSSWLGLRDLPPVFVAQRANLDGRTVEHVGLTANEGLLIRANFVAPDWDAEQLRFELLARLVAQKSQERTLFEPKAWLSDGLLRWWVEQKRSTQVTSLSLLRGLWATQQEPVTAALLERWILTNERLGSDVAEGLAHTGIEVLARVRGRGAVDALARAVLGRWAPKDARALHYESVHSTPALFREATGLAWPDFLARWNQELPRLRQEPRFQALAALPRGRVQISTQAARGAIRDVRFVVELDRPAPAGLVVSLAHYRLSAFDRGLVPKLELERQDSLWPASSTRFEGRLPGSYSRGDRAFLAVEIQGAPLATPLRLSAERRSFE
jgi:hypothetical protein